MEPLIWVSLRALFQFLCFGVTSLMIGYWCFIFGIKDEDLSLVDYKIIEKSKVNDLPVISMCIMNPFLIERLRETNPNISYPIYSMYLKGDFWDDQLATVNYNNVTINISDYLSQTTIRLRNGSLRTNISKAYSIDVTFNGFINDAFFKCFGMKNEDEFYRDIQTVTFYFKPHPLFDGSLRSSHWIGFLIHYPREFLLSSHFKWFINDVKRNATTLRYQILIKDEEILQRRNKAKEPCMEDGKYYDDLVLKRHIEEHECRAPYHMADTGVPTCTTKTQIAASRYEAVGMKAKYPNRPCRIMSKIDWTIEEFYNIGWFHLAIQIEYPDHLKIVKQSKSVDIHAFIGNIGGYIGLFLGYAIIQVPDLLLFLYERIKKMKYFSDVSKSNARVVAKQNSKEVFAADTAQEINAQETHYKSYRPDVINRMYRMEEDILVLFEKLDKMTTSVDGISEKLDKWQIEVSFFNALYIESRMKYNQRKRNSC